MRAEAMSTSSEHALRAAAAVANTNADRRAVINLDPDADRAQRVAAAEAAATQAIEAARQAAANTAAALRAELER